MKIILLEIEKGELYPPFLSVLKILADLKLEVCLIDCGQNDDIISYCLNNNIKIIHIDTVYDGKKAFIIKCFDFLRLRRQLWNAVEQIYCDGDILWVFSYSTLKILGKKLLKYKYILHLFELIDRFYLCESMKLIKFDLAAFCHNATKVVVCEQNRAYITQALMGLKELPVVLPNKPYFFTALGLAGLDCNIFKRLMTTITKLAGKKVILYQGYVSPERPLYEFIAAMDYLDNEYVFLLLGGQTNPYPDVLSDRYIYISYIPAPYHLEVTKIAYIGVLNYQPQLNDLCSPLNAIYCAPNKIYEYSRFGLPMIGNDIPGLQETITRYEAGICLEKVDRHSIAEAIIKIDRNIELYRKHSLNFYNSTDCIKIIDDMLTEIKEQRISK